MENLSKIRRFLEPALAYRAFLIRGIVINGLHGLYPIVAVAFSGLLIDAIRMGDRSRFDMILAVFIAISCGYYPLTYFWRHWGWSESYYTYRKYIADRYVRKFVSLDNNATETLGTGKIIASLDQGVRAWCDLLTDLVGSGTTLAITLVSAAYFFAKTGPTAMLVFFLVLAILGWRAARVNRGILKYRRDRIEADKECTREFVKIVSSKFEILLSGKTDHEIRVFNRWTDVSHAANLRMNDYLFGMFSLPSLLLAVLTVGIYLYAGKRAFAGSVTVGEISAMAGYLALFEKTATRFLGVYKDFTKNFSTLENFWEMFDSTGEIRTNPDGKEFHLSNGLVELSHVDYSYGSKVVFKNFSLRFEPGKKTALVGASGSWKTTIAKLVSGYLHADCGDVVVDGQPLSEIRLASYHSHIGYLTQEPSVFDGTIRENLAYGSRETPDEKTLERALRLAKCEFVFELEAGLETEIGERGVRLSGGQKQRLAIAKIFLKNPEIVILDEPTSALDSFSEEKISEAFEELFRWRTVIIIAHRLQTVKGADDIVVMENSAVVERGTHGELIAKGKTYFRMVELQSGF